MGLTGCLRNLQHDGTDVGAPDRIVSTESCSANTERGTFFGADGGYVQLRKLLHPLACRSWRVT